MNDGRLGPDVHRRLAVQVQELPAQAGQAGYPSQLEFGLKGGLSLPAALNPGQQVALLLDRIAVPLRRQASFDDLPTPFRASPPT